MGNKRVRRCLIHAIAQCQDCDWDEEDYKVAQKKAREHAIKTGHTVDVETGYWHQYNPKEEN